MNRATTAIAALLAFVPAAAQARVVELGGQPRSDRELPRQLPGDRPGHRLPGADGPQRHPFQVNAPRQDRRLHDPARQAERGADLLLQPPLRRQVAGAALGAEARRARSTASSRARARSSRSTSTSARRRRSSSTRPLTVKKDYVVALTVPTWAPAFAVNLAERRGMALLARPRSATTSARRPRSRSAAEPAHLRLPLQDRAPPLHGHVHPGPAQDHEDRAEDRGRGRQLVVPARPARNVLGGASPVI